MASVDSNSIQAAQISNRQLAAWGIGLFVALFILGYFLISSVMWLFRSSAPKPLLPVPVILKEELVQNLLADNQMKVTIRNDGPAGLVRIEIYSVEDVEGQFTRGESGVERTLRETFTRENEPQSKYVPDFRRIEYGNSNAEFQKGETKTVTIPIPRYNWISNLSGVKLYADAKAAVVPSRTK